MHPALPGLHFETMDSINGALWTIKIELAFYILLPLLIWFIKKLKSLFSINLTLFLLYTMSVLYTFIIERYFNVLHLPQQLVNQFPAFVSCFACGIFCLFNFEWIQKHLNVLALVSLPVFLLHYLTKTEFLMPLSLTFLCFFFALKFSVLGRLTVSKDYSYQIYLFHFPLIQLLVLCGFFKDCFSVSLFCVISVSIVISVFAEYLFSIPERLSIT